MGWDIPHDPGLWNGIFRTTGVCGMGYSARPGSVEWDIPHDQGPGSVEWACLIIRFCTCLLNQSSDFVERMKGLQIMLPMEESSAKYLFT